MAKRYRNDPDEVLGLIVIMLVSAVVGFITKYWKIILLIAITFSILFLIIYLCVKKKKKEQNNINFVKKLPLSFTMSKLKKKGTLYYKIVELNNKYYLEELKPLYFTYSVRSRKGLRDAYIDDYLLMTIDREESKINWYIGQIRAN